MGAEKKKLLLNAEADASGDQRTGFKLHYFPDIPLDDPDDMRTCIPLRNSFQRTRFGNQTTDCEEFSRTYGDHDVKKTEESEASTDRFDVEAYQKGFNDGLEKGSEEGERLGFERASKKMEPLLDSLQEALLQLKNLRAETYHQIEIEVVELALAIARKVICREIKMDREVVLCVAREALARIEDPGKIKIKMSPEDLQFINETQYKLSDLIGNLDNFSLEAEENIPSGGCIIETSLGEIDALIENQIQAVEESFRKAVESSGKQI